MFSQMLFTLLMFFLFVKFKRRIPDCHFVGIKFVNTIKGLKQFKDYLFNCSGVLCDVRKRKQIWAFHQLFSELFDFLQNENLVPWFFYWLLYLFLDGNIFPYFSTLYSFISSKYLAKWNSKIRHSNNPSEFECPRAVFWIIWVLRKKRI